MDLNRSASYGLIQANVREFEREMVFTSKFTPHSSRGWSPTCANQLDFPREGLERLGHWAPGSIMPDRYYKAVCATELKLRCKIFAEIRTGRRPHPAFQVATQPPAETGVGNPRVTSIPKHQLRQLALSTGKVGTMTFRTLQNRMNRK